MSNSQNLVGEKFGKLKVVRRIENGKFNSIRYECECDCGQMGIVLASNLKSGHTRSCGCLRKLSPNRLTHGATSGRRFGKRGTPEYISWTGMKNRCFNKKCQDYPDYGGRGIGICERWQGPQGFENFLADMGSKPSPKHSLDRKNNDLNYDPDNCQWATPKEQAANRRIKRIENFSLESLLTEIKRRKRVFSRDWDIRFLNLCKHIAQWSKDPSTQVGAVIVRDDKTIISLGFNGFVKGASDSPNLYQNRSEKLSRIIHAEINALLHAKTSIEGAIIYSWPFMPCHQCCTQLIQAGIARFVYCAASKESLERWGESFQKSLQFLEELRIDHLEIPQEEME